MDIYACFLFINARTSSIYAPGADPCFLRAPPCFPFSHLCMRSAATFVCIPRSTSVTNKQRRTMWHCRQKHKRLQFVWDCHYNPLCITLFLSCPGVEVLILPRHITFCACSLSPFSVPRAWKSDTVWISCVSTFDSNRKIITDCGKPNEIVLKEDNIWSVVIIICGVGSGTLSSLAGLITDSCYCVSFSFSHGHRPHYSAVLLRLHLQARWPSQRPALRQRRDGEILPGCDNWRLLVRRWRKLQRLPQHAHGGPSGLGVPHSQNHHCSWYGWQ